MTSVLAVFFFNDTATTEIYTLSLHDALPISFKIPFPSHERGVRRRGEAGPGGGGHRGGGIDGGAACGQDRKSTRLNSSHANISYAVFCLKKKNKASHHLLTHPLF